MESGQGKIQEELREVEEEIELGDGHNDRLQSLEEGGPLDEDTIELEIGTTPSKPAFKERIRRHAQVNKVKEGARNFASLFFGPVFVQSFVLTFLGEWGDRSQIATIALAAAHVSTLSGFFSASLAHTPFVECIYCHFGYRNRA